MLKVFAGWVESKQYANVAKEVEEGSPSGWHLPVYADKQPHMDMVFVRVTVLKREGARS